VTLWRPGRSSRLITCKGSDSDIVCRSEWRSVSEGLSCGWNEDDCKGGELSDADRLQIGGEVSVREEKSIVERR
jgi:hypothetical protein